MAIQGRPNHELALVLDNKSNWQERNIAMSLDILLSRLDGVRHTGQGQWIAKCPAHADRKASLAIRELDDGRILLHDFAGCATADVLAAVDLTFSDLFPERGLDAHHHPVRRPFNARDVLRCLAYEVLVVLQIANLLLRGGALTESDHARLLLAARRFQSAEGIANE
ncbi:DNA primase [Undibacterium arcticum]